MPMHVHRTALVAHPAGHLFALIEAVEHYPAFLPWCRAVQVLERSDEVVAARLELAWAGLRLGIATRNPKRAPTWMAITLQEGPFRHFSGQWQLTPLAEWGCRVEFSLDYEFDTALIGSIATPLFDKAVNSLVDAFVRRADAMLPAPAPVTPSATPAPAPAPTPPPS
ncbi:MAG: type II toxin-antitoxin system RatA family toxin [Rubrivivax sp.]|nr:type II toxin-antitoxin system RatA family toxin [Rubrivivax sp.]